MRPISNRGSQARNKKTGGNPVKNGAGEGKRAKRRPNREEGSEGKFLREREDFARKRKGDQIRTEVPERKAKKRTRKCSCLERVKGIEPSWPAWEAEVLPLNYTRIFNFCNDFLPH